MGSVCKNYTFENVSATFNSSIFIGVIDEFDKERYMSVIEFKEDYFPIFFGRPKDFKLAVPDYQMRWISNNEIRLESFSIMRWVKVEIEKEEC